VSEAERERMRAIRRGGAGGERDDKGGRAQGRRESEGREAQRDAGCGGRR
jgi:hypothetical protein